MTATTQQSRRTVFWTDEERIAVYEHVYDVMIHEGKNFPIRDGHGLPQLMFSGQSIVLPSSNRYRPITSFQHTKERAKLIEWLNEHHKSRLKEIGSKQSKAAPKEAPSKDTESASEFFQSSKKREALPENPFHPPLPASLEALPSIPQVMETLNKTLDLLHQQNVRNMAQEQAVQQATLTTLQALTATVNDLQYSVRRMSDALISFKPNIHLNVEAPEGTKVTAMNLGDDSPPDVDQKPLATPGNIPQARKPRIAIYGLFPNQKQEILNEFGDMLDIVSYENTLTMKPVDSADRAYYMIKAGNKSSSRAGRQFYGDRFETITGSTSQLKAKIHEYLETITC
jgi:hypothetical protein